MDSMKFVLVFAGFLATVKAAAVLPDKAPVAFDFVGTVEEKIFLLANQLGVIYY